VRHKELLRRLALGEGATLELKARADALPVGGQICAFLNSGGG